MKQRVFKPAPIEVRFAANPGDIIINSSRDAYEVLLDQYDTRTLDLREELRLLPLDPSNRVLGVSLLTTGNNKGTVVDIPLVISIVVAVRANAFILCHNHPSGKLMPSDADIRVTQRIREACDLIDIQLLDHLILTRNGYYSFADEGVI